MRISEVQNSEAERWNQFVHGHTLSTVSHLFEWKTVYETAYGLRTSYLAAFEEDRMLAVFPVAFVAVPLRGRKAISLPYLNSAGWLIQGDSDAETIGKAFLATLSGAGSTSIELRKIVTAGAGDTREATMRRKLPESPDALWTSLDAKVRNQVRKATRLGLTARWGSDQLDEFYDVYTRSMQFLGTPAHRRKFFEQILHRLPDASTILTVRLDNKAIAAMMLLSYKDQMSDPWAGSLREFDTYCSNMLMYWEAMRHASERGFRVFDLGRSELNSGTYRFKRQWGAEPTPLEYVTLDGRGERLESSVSFYRSDSARFMSRMWRMSPRALTRWLGPRLRKYLP